MTINAQRQVKMLDSTRPKNLDIGFRNVQALRASVVRRAARTRKMHGFADAPNPPAHH